MTKYGQQILDIINNSYCHPSAEEIFAIMKKADSKVVLATVYNNLNSLVEKKLIRRLCFDSECDRFDSLREHQHLVCCKCGKIKDVVIDGLKEELTEKLQTEFDSIELTLNYVCPECKEK